MVKTLAVVGATGAVGQIILQLLEERNFPAETVRLLASARSAGKTVTFRGKPVTVEELTPTAFEGVDLVIASTPDETSRDFLPHAVKAGAKVIDESGYWRMKPEVALVVPEINPEAALEAEGIIASPNCSTTQMVMALKPLHDAARIKRVVVSTYQAVSGAGLAGTKELYDGTRAQLANEPFKESTFSHPIAFNAIPQIGSFKEEGYTSEELKMVYETRKILSRFRPPACAFQWRTVTVRIFGSKRNGPSLPRRRGSCLRTFRESRCSMIPKALSPCPPIARGRMTSS